MDVCVHKRASAQMPNRNDAGKISIMVMKAAATTVTMTT